MNDSDFDAYLARINRRREICRVVREGLKEGIVEHRHIEEVLREARNENTFPFRFSERFKFDHFIQEERKHYPDDKNNRFAAGFGQVGRYEHFLSKILVRYRRICAEVNEISTKAKETLKAHRFELDERKYFSTARMFELGLEAQLEVESFYIFAKMLLDHIARSVEHHFGAVRSASFDSHDDLVKNLSQFQKGHDLMLPLDFKELADDLKKRVADFRDYQIAHNKLSRAMHASLFTGNDSMTMQISSWNDPNLATAPKVSEPLLAMMTTIDQYISGMIELVTLNRQRSKYLRPPHPRSKRVVEPDV